MCVCYKSGTDLRAGDLLFGELLIAGELVDGDAEGLEPLAEVQHHLLHQRLHRGHVDDLKEGREGIVSRVQGALCA